jgi:hypothetical protein
MAEKPTPPRGARLLAVSGQDDNFILYGNLTKTIIDDNWHNYQDFERVISTGSVVTATDGTKWLIGSGYRGDERLYDGYIPYTDRDKIWYDLPTVQVPAPNRPAQSTAVAMPGIRVGLSFTAVAGAAIEVERATAQAGPFTKVGTAKTGETSYTDVNLKPLTDYYYRLRASNDNGDSTYTDVMLVTTLAEVTPVGAPTPTPTTSTPTVNTLPSSMPAVTNVTTQQNPTKSWLESNLMVVLIGGGLLVAVIVAIVSTRD